MSSPIEEHCNDTFSQTSVGKDVVISSIQPSGNNKEGTCIRTEIHIVFYCKHVIAGSSLRLLLFVSHMEFYYQSRNIKKTSS